MNMRLWTHAFGTLFMLCSTALYGQWGLKVNFLDTDFGWNKSENYLNHNVGLGFDRDLTSKISIGADVSHSWDIAWKGSMFATPSGLVDSRVTTAYVADDGLSSNSSTRYERSGREVTGWLRAVYLFTGNSRASWYAGPILGVRYRQEEIDLVKVPHPEEGTQDLPTRLRHNYMLFPVGLKLGLRDEMPNGYFDLCMRMTYEIGGGRHLYDELPTLTTHHALDAVRSPEWYIGMGVAYGFCLSGCGR